MSLRKAFVRTGAAVLIGAASFTWPMAARAAGPDRSAATTTASTIGIDNFARINANYYRGAQPDGDEYAQLAALGVKTVIDLTRDDTQPNERSMVETAGMTYVQIPMTTHTAPTRDEVAKFLRIVNDPRSQPVYVHCVGGRHRTGVMTAVYRMSNDGWTADQAFAEMKHYKFGADILHPEFKRFVYAYHADSAHMVVATRVGS